MRIDLRLLLPVALPFVLVLLGKAVFWFAGAELSDPVALAVVSVIFGPLIGLVATVVLYGEGTEIGHLDLSKLIKRGGE